ncbi:hypothetical protein RUND412_005962 [Rhizina undulata]
MVKTISTIQHVKAVLLASAEGSIHIPSMSPQFSLRTTLLSALGFTTAILATSDPVVTLSSGKLIGKYLPTFNQDVFLGIPYAGKTPRFTPSTLITTKSNDIKQASEYGYTCPGFGSDTTTLLDLGLIEIDEEECLNLNVIIPKVSQKAPLPVLVWIYGGGWQQGSSADPRYNMSYIIQQSVENGKPVIGVSINYRLGGFGFLFGKDVMNSGNTNLGLRDQRVAFEFIQQNIGAFGGDPEKVTIWGESAGAYSVGLHLIAYGGQDQKLFRAAIMESGNAVGPPWNDTRWYQPLYDRLATNTSCYNATDTLDCLRAVPYDTIYAALNAISYEWFAVIDGNFMQSWPVAALKAGKLVDVPILLGSNTDEGVSFGATGVNTDEEALAQLISSKRWVVTPYQASEILARYPNDPTVGSPYGTGTETFSKFGAQYKRYSSIAGDLTMAAPRRLLAERYAQHTNSGVWSYRFDTPLLNSTSRIGIVHFSEVPYVFCNPVQTLAPLGPDPSDLKLGQLMARMWTSFAHDLDPNGHGVSGIPNWPSYRDAPKNFVFRNDTSYVEDDMYRSEGMAYINDILR